MIYADHVFSTSLYDISIKELTSYDMTAKLKIKLHLDSVIDWSISFNNMYLSFIIHKSL